MVDEAWGWTLDPPGLPWRDSFEGVARVGWVGRFKSL
jgi:hypothetical protein